MTVKHVAFTMYPVSDLARAEKFYGEALGLLQNGTRSEMWIEYEVGGATFGIGAFPQVGTPGTAQSLALEVADLAAFRAQLAAKGVDTTEPHHFPGCMIALVRDPDGNQIWLHQLKDAAG